LSENPPEFEASGESPPTQSPVQAQLAEELAEIIADALIADLQDEAAKVPAPHESTTKEDC
jgi:hypothetical protein